jgi:hypothetical protein
MSRERNPPMAESAMTDLTELDRLVATFTVDAYDVAEQITAFHAVFTGEVEEPMWATIVGVPVLVLDADVRDTGMELTAHCRREGEEQEISFTDLVFPPDTVAAWIHAAYRRYLGLQPFPAAIPPGWEPDWL